jgi:acetyl esterase/lipase
MNVSLWLLSFACILYSCEGKPGNKDISASNTLVQMNVAYGNDSAQRMDIYLPGPRSSDHTISLILIHGGGWSMGDKADHNPYISTLRTKLPGYAIFNINYRLAKNNRNLFPTQENDVKAAVEYIYDKRVEYKISDKFVLIGASAGAQLALLQAYKYIYPVKIAAAVSIFGATDLSILYQTSPAAALLLRNAIGVTPDANPTLYQQSSPVHFVSPSACPTLLLHGGKDSLILASQSELLHTLLDKAGVSNEYILYPSEGHGWRKPALQDSYDKIGRFIKKYVN